MSAETLRRAARLMRERAEAATPGRWQALCDGYGDTSGADRRDLMWVRAGETNESDVVSTYGSPDATLVHDNVTHIASWHPVVAHAVADWLDHEARYFANDSTGKRALAAARAYLGEGS